MNHLFRELAPVSDAAWAEIETEATRTLRNFLAGRKVVDLTGPLGWEHSATDLGQVDVDSLRDPLADGVEAGIRRVQPLVELRTRFTMARRELDSIDRGNKAPDLEPVIEAARAAALAEDRAIFSGYEPGGIAGISTQSPHDAITIDDDYEQFPNAVARAVAILRAAGVDGPFGVALGPRCYTNVIETTQRGGYPVLEQLRLITGGPLVWAPAVDGSIVLSLRGGDFELVSGEDFSIGYAGHDADSVVLFLEESMTFRAHTPEAAVVLAHAS
jgi:uncharacterized linocin/CFP29 family protein